MAKGKRLSIKPGAKFGRLTVVCEDGKRNPRYFVCACGCGTQKIVRLDSLRRGEIVSCGCYNREISRAKNTKHGLSQGRIYRIWQGVKSRCLNPNNTSYNHYGGRRIVVCSEWMEFEVFSRWAIANGYRDDLTIERIDVNGNYEPENCSWVPVAEQRRNTTRVHKIEIDGEAKTQRQWAAAVNMHQSTLRHRLGMGIPLEEAITTPVKPKRLVEHHGESKNIAEWAREVGVKDATIRQRLKRGWSIEESLSIAPKLTSDFNI